MTIARRGTNFNWQLRMLQQASFNCGSGECPEPCLTVTEMDQIPVNADNCPSGFIRTIIDGVDTDYMMWDGVVWSNLSGITTLTSTDAQGSLLAGWEISINGVWYTRAEWMAGITFEAPITEATFMYRNLTGCILLGRTEAVESLVYNYFWIQDPGGGGNDFTGWTINGEAFFLNQSVMQSFNGNAFFYILNTGTNPWAALLWYIGDVVPTITLLNELGDPVPYSWSPIPTPACFKSSDDIFNQATSGQYFTYAEIATIDFNTAVTGVNIDDPGFEAACDAWIKTMFGASASFTINIIADNVVTEINNAYFTPTQLTTFAAETLLYNPAVCP